MADPNNTNFNKCLFIKAEAFHDFAGISIGTYPITASNMAERLSSDIPSNLTRALSKNIGKTCSDDDKFTTLPILKDTTDGDQITNLTFNKFTDSATTLKNCNTTTLKNKLQPGGKAGGNVPLIGSGRIWLKSIPKNMWSNQTVNTKSGESNVKVFHLEQEVSSSGLVKGATQYGNDVMNIFDRCESAPTTGGFATPTHKHIFFVVDVGDHFRNKILKKIQALPGDTKRIFIHTIHSNETLSDPAGKNDPANANFIYKQPLTNNNKFFCLSWLYSSQVSTTGTAIITTINNNEPLPITSYNITLEREAVGWTIAVRWHQPATTGNSEFKPTRGNGDFQPFYGKDQSISKMTDEIDDFLGTQTGAFFFGTAETDDRKLKQVGSFYQRKRSGDYLQIYFADKLASYLINTQYPTTNKFQLIRPDKAPTLSPGSKWGDFTDFYPSATPAQTFPIDKCFALTGSKTAADYAKVKKNIFFVTGDHPALDYALYNKINVILAPPPGGKMASHIWVFHFD
mgnify:CR=1 FL=1